MYWWGYQHENGNVQVKPFYEGPGTVASIQDAHQSPFVTEVLDEPFSAPDRAAALDYARRRLDNKAALFSPA